MSVLLLIPFALYPHSAVAEENLQPEIPVVCPLEPTGLVQIPSLNSDVAFDCVQEAWEIYEDKSRYNYSFSIYNSVVHQFEDRSRKDKDITFSLELNCKAKRLRANLYIDSSEMIEGYQVGYRIKTDSFKMGAISVKFDNAQFKKFKYIEPKGEAVFIQESKKFTTALLKTKSMFIVKISSEELGNSVVDFPILDLAKYKNRFKSLGCALS
jgi:hypothetical protein